MDKAKYLQKLRKEMEKVQAAKRFSHTLGVEFTAAALAMRYQTDLFAAQTAGLLHDCAKCLTDEKLLHICEKHGIPVSEVERRNPFLLHAKAGEYLAREKYGVSDPDILSAIRFHTTGRENMSLLEKIIFIADYIEPGRDQAPELPEIRKLAFTEPDEAVLRILEGTLAHIRKKGCEADPATERTRQYYQTKNKSEA